MSDAKPILPTQAVTVRCRRKRCGWRGRRKGRRAVVHEWWPGNFPKRYSIVKATMQPCPRCGGAVDRR